MLRLATGDLLWSELRPKRNATANDAPALGGERKLFQIIAWVRLARVRCEWAATLSLEVSGVVVSEVVVLDRVLSCSRVVFRGEDIDGGTYVCQRNE